MSCIVKKNTRLGHDILFIVVSYLNAYEKTFGMLDAPTSLSHFDCVHQELIVYGIRQRGVNGIKCKRLSLEFMGLQS